MVVRVVGVVVGAAGALHPLGHVSAGEKGRGLQQGPPWGQREGLSPGDAGGAAGVFWVSPLCPTDRLRGLCSARVLRGWDELCRRVALGHVASVCCDTRSLPWGTGYLFPSYLAEHLPAGSPLLSLCGWRDTERGREPLGGSKLWRGCGDAQPVWGRGLRGMRLSSAREPRTGCRGRNPSLGLGRDHLAVPHGTWVVKGLCCPKATSCTRPKDWWGLAMAP